MISSLELARLCGVSQGTVDRALHDRPGVAEQTRKRILAAAERHGYRPNRLAQAVLHGQRSEVRVLVSSANSPFYGDQIAAVHRSLPEGMHLLIALGHDSERDEFLAEAAAARAAAAILINPSDGPAIPDHIRGSLPVFSLINPCPGTICLLPNERATGREATAHLLALGHSRIVHLRPASDNWAINEREAGYQEALTGHGLAPQVITSVDRLPDLIADGACTAVFAHNDPSALTAIAGLHQAGFRVPQDCSVIGVDHAPTLAPLTGHLTTMAYPFASLATALLAQLAQRQPPAIEDCRLVVGSTTAPRPA